MSYIEKLEQYREANELSKSDMGRLLGIDTKPYQYYENWIQRNSLPASYIDKAKAILGLVEIGLASEDDEAYQLIVQIIKQGKTASVIDFLRFVADA
jgi:hypothetical protein